MLYAVNSGRPMTVRVLVVMGLIAALLLGLVVNAALSTEAVLRLSPQSLQLEADSKLPEDIQALEQASLAFGFDRDTTSEYTAYGESSVTLKLAQATSISHIKIYDAAPYDISIQAWVSGTWQPVAGLQSLDLSSLTTQWHRFDASTSVHTNQVKINFASSSGGSASGLKELEIWGLGERVTINTGANLLAAIDNNQPVVQARVYAADLQEAIIGDVAGLQDQAADNRLQVKLDEDLGSVKRAWLSYESHGAGHWVSTTRSINQNPFMGGHYRFASSAWTVQVEPINPAWLKPGANHIEFSVAAQNSYRIRNLKLLLELDNGSNMLDSLTAFPEAIDSQAAFAADGDILSAWQPYASALAKGEDPYLQLNFDQASQLDSLELLLENSLAGKIELEVLENGEWTNAGVAAILGKKLTSGWNSIDFQRDTPVEGVKLVFINGAGSPGEIVEIAPRGSKVGEKQSPARIDVGYPEAGQYYGDQAYIRGFVTPMDNGSGQAKVFIAGEEVSRIDGAFETLVSQAAFTQESNGYSVTVDVRYPDGQQLARKILLQDAYSASIANATLSTYAYGGSAPDAQQQQALQRAINPADIYRIEHDESVLQLSKEALDEKESPRNITIASLKHDDLPPLNPGMTNVTKGPRRGYRFSPHGKKFRKNIEVYIPYDKTRIPAGLSEEDIKTWYFDEELGRWVPLDRVAVNKKEKVVKSHSDHFTDMINATLTVPEHPQAASFNPTQIKDIKAANPASALNLIEPPQANNQGSANLSYPIEIPAGRNGMQPQLAVQYNSGAANSWLGMGWDLTVPSISIETRWGVPRYSASLETETYLLNGQMMTPLAHRGELKPRQSEKKDFHLRVEGSYNKIIRRGNHPSNYWWIVTDKTGNQAFYGGDESAQLKSATLGGAKGVFKWMLVKSVDANGNTVEYKYQKECDTGVGNGRCVSGTVHGYQIYVSEIIYTGHSKTPAVYSVEFIREAERRTDVSMDARGGFKMVTAHRLHRIKVKYKEQLIRSYRLDYKPGGFEKSLLDKLVQLGPEDTDDKPFNYHQFDYYNELVKTQDKKGYIGFKSGNDWLTGNDGVRLNLLGNDFDASIVSGTKGKTKGSHSYKGLFIGTWTDKSNSYGKAKSSNSSTTDGLLSLVDVDGDSLPDKLYRGEGGFYYYRRNTWVPGMSLDDEVSFSKPKRIDFLPGISQSTSVSNSKGIEGYFGGGSAYRHKGNTVTTENTYLMEVNGDGMIDIVSNGIVYFGYFKEDNPNPETHIASFSDNSVDTGVRVGSGGIDAANLIPNLTDIENKILADNPLSDAVRRWQAPYTGSIRIDGQVQLHDYSKDNLSEEELKAYEDYATADGVRLAIQKNASELWSARITPEHTGNYPLKSAPGAVEKSDIHNISVKKGDKIYFRVQSVFDGAYDGVDWQPEITYLNKEAFKDVNNLNVYKYHAGNDFTLGGRATELTAPFTGTLKFTGTFKKTKVTTDDVTLQVVIYKRSYDNQGNMTSETSSVALSKSFAHDQLVELELNDEFNVEEKDQIRIKIEADSQIDLTQISWDQPSLHYIKAYTSDRELLQSNLPDPGADDDTTSAEEIAITKDDVSPLLDANGEPIVIEGEQITNLYDVQTNEPLYTLPVAYDMDNYPLNNLKGAKPQQPWIVNESGFVYITPWVSFKGHECGDEDSWSWFNRKYEDCIEEYKFKKNRSTDVTLTVKRRGQLLHKQKIHINNGIVEQQANGFNGLVSMYVEKGDELFYDFSVKDPYTAEIIYTKLHLHYGSKTAWSIPFDDKVTFDVKFRGYYEDHDDDDNYVPPSDKVVFNRQVMQVIRKGNTIVDKKLYKLETNYNEFKRQFTSDVKAGEQYYFDYFAVDKDAKFYDDSVWARSYDPHTWTAEQDAKVKLLPKLNFKSSSSPTGNFEVYVYKNGKYIARIYYVVNKGLVSRRYAYNEDRDYDLDVKKGELYRFDLRFPQHHVSSALADRGQIMLDSNTANNWIVPEWGNKQNIRVTPALSFAGAAQGVDGVINFTTHIDGNQAGQMVFEVKNGRLSSLNPEYLDLQVDENSRVSFTFYTDSADVYRHITEHSVSVTHGSYSLQAPHNLNAAKRYIPSYALHTLMPRLKAYQPERDSVLHNSIIADAFPSAFRGWSVIGYNGNDYLEKPMVEKRLELSTNKDDYKGDSEDKNYPAFSEDGVDAWQIEDEDWAITRSMMASSRNGLNYLRFPRAEDYILAGDNPDQGYAPAMRTPKMSRANTRSWGGGYWINYNNSKTDPTTALTEVLDLNGDRFPDILKGQKVQFTRMDGGLEPAVRSTNIIPDGIRNSWGNSESISIGPSPGKSDSDSDNEAPDNPPPVPEEPQLIPVGFSPSGSFGIASNGDHNVLMDVNGDGLPDKVKQVDGKIEVRLNLGYEFADKENWGEALLNDGSSSNATAGLGISSLPIGWGTGYASFSGGVSITASKNDTKAGLYDVNGDGMIDRVLKGDGGYWVGFNIGGRFLAPVRWSGGVSSLLGDGKNISKSENISGTLTILIPPTLVTPPISIHYTKGKTRAKSISRQELMLRDVNGDGYIDSVFSDKESFMKVAINQTGKTNLLRSVRRPLGSRFDLQYERSGNTYKQPQSRWIMTRLEVFDGVRDNFNERGADYQLSRFAYSGGYYDRQERDFYGYASVISTQYDTTGLSQAKLDSAGKYRRVTQTYATDSAYLKGLMLDSLTQGYKGELTEKYQLSKNKYELRNAFAKGLIEKDSLALSGFPALVSTEHHYFEGQATAGLVSRQEFDYDDYGNVDVFRDKANLNDSSDDVEAIITYTECASSNIRKAKSIVVNGYKGYGKQRAWGELRSRNASINCTTGNMQLLHQKVGGETAITELKYSAEGNLESVKNPQDFNGDNYTLQFGYDDARLFVSSVTDDYFGYSSSSVTDPKFGKPLCTADLNDNQIRYYYDQYGRTKRIIGPYELGDSAKAQCPDKVEELSTVDASRYTIRFNYRTYLDIDSTFKDSWALTQHYDRDAQGNAKDPIETVLFIDGLQRVLQTKKDASVSDEPGVAPKPKMVVSGRVVFDGLGRKVEQYYPISEDKGSSAPGSANLRFNHNYEKAIKPTATTYDVLDRPLQTTLPDTSKIYQHYDFGRDRYGIEQMRTRITDANGIVKYSYSDSRQLITSIQESVEKRDIEGKTLGESETLWTSYRYDSIKQITDVKDAYGNETFVDYDQLGRRTLIDNPDAGATRYAYDLAGNMVKKITAVAHANQQFIEYKYDHNRLTHINYPIAEHNIIYVYGDAGASSKLHNQFGRIKEVRHSAGAELREYGKLGETSAEQFTVTAVRGGPEPTYITRYQFDTFGRLLNLTYPSGEQLVHEYDSGGNLSKITGKFQGVDYDYLQALHYDRFEQRLYMQLGNGIETRYTYREDNRRLKNLNSQGKLAGEFQNFDYVYDRAGNIRTLDNKVQIPPASEVGGPSSYTFEYDELHRLVSASGNFKPRRTQEHNYTYNMVYDGIHNITQKRQLHTFGKVGQEGKRQRATSYDWAYKYNPSGEDSVRPHAPQLIGERAFEYDANGNQSGFKSTVNGQRRNIVWDDENRIREINDPGNTAWYAYDDQGQRKVKRGRYGETVYVNQFMTVRDGALATLHVYAGNTRVVSKLKPGKPIGRKADATGYTTLSTSNGKTSSANKQTNVSTGKGQLKQADKPLSPGQQKAKEKAQLKAVSQNQGKGQTKAKNQAKGNTRDGSQFNKVHANHPGQGLLHRSERANEVAQNTVKNRHLNGSSGTGGDTGSDAGDNTGGDSGSGGSGNTGGTGGTGGSDGSLAEIAYDFSGGAEFLYYYHPDHLGSTGYVSDKKGELYEHIVYFPSGETWVQEGVNNWKVPYLYTSKELDQDTQLYYFGARYYDPRTSVWQSADPIIGDYLGSDMSKLTAQGVFRSANLALFTYAHNNSIKLKDPDGKSVYLIDTISGQINRIKTKANFDVFAVRDGPSAGYQLIGAFQKNSSGLIQLNKNVSVKLRSGRTVGFNVKKGNEYRSYASGEAVASLLGASYDSQASDLTVVGFSLADGSSPSPSKSHVSGKNGDIRYLRTDKSGGPLWLSGGKNAEPSKFDSARQGGLNKALRKYGWKDILGSRYKSGGKTHLPPGTRHFRNHHHHEHLQGYRPNVQDVK